MEIVPIFVPENGDHSQCCLWAAHFPGEEFDEFERLFEDWNDVRFLRMFFEENKTDLEAPFWQHRLKTRSAAVMKVIEEAAGLESDLRLLEARISDGEDGSIIQEIFQPYYNNEIAPIILKGKAKGAIRPYLRLYGLFLQDHSQIIIFGGGIKLTEKVNKDQSPHLLAEIQKAIRVKQFLKENGIQFLD